MAKKATNEQLRQWAADALAMAANLPDSVDRDLLLQSARQHLQAIAWQESRKQPTEKFAVAPTGIW
jgi:hypothetical protein